MTIDQKLHALLKGGGLQIVIKHDTTRRFYIVLEKSDNTCPPLTFSAGEFPSGNDFDSALTHFVGTLVQNSIGTLSSDKEE